MPVKPWNWRFQDQSKAGKWALQMHGLTAIGTGVCPRGSTGTVSLPSRHLLLFTVAGAGFLSQESRRKKMNAGTLGLLPAADRYEVGAATRWEVIWFQLETTSHWTSLLPPQATTCPASSITIIRLVAGIFLSNDSSQTRDKNRTFYEVYAQVIISLLRLELNFAGLSSNQKGSRLEQLWHEVEADPIKPWTTETLAKISGYSRSHLQATVRQAHGCGAMEMVARIRMKHSMKLIQDPAMKLADVAESVGYQSPFSFSKAFKRIVGMNPEDFRRQA